MGAAIITPIKSLGRNVPTGFDPGPGNLVVQQGIYETSTVKKHALGTRLQIGNRVFYYASAGGALVAGLLTESAVFGGSATVIQTNLAVATATNGSNVAGQPLINVTMATDTPTLDQFAGGYLSGYDTTAANGMGSSFRIKKNSAAAAPCVIELHDDIPSGVSFVAGTSKVNVISNEFYNVQTRATTPVGFPTGVPVVACASGSYCWLQTFGPVCMLLDSSGTDAVQLLASLNTAGGASIQVAGGSSLAAPSIGFLMHLAIASGKYGMVFLQLMI
jgi:hypothetical protein